MFAFRKARPTIDRNDKKELKSDTFDKIAFLHIPKCGGTSVEAALKKKFPKREISPLYFTREFQSATKETLEKYSLIIGHFDYDTMGLLSPAWCRTIVLRDPASLLVSLYNHAASRASHRLHSRIAAGELSFVRFCSEPGTRNILSKSLLGRKAYFRLMRDGDTPNAGAATSLAKKNLATFDCVGMIDRLEAFRRSLCEILQLDLPAFPRLNSSPNAIRLESLSSSEKGALVRNNELDLSIYQTVRETYEANNFNRPES